MYLFAIFGNCNMRFHAIIHWLCKLDTISSVEQYHSLRSGVLIQKLSEW